MPFKPGESGNRAGRPKGFAGVAKMIARETHDYADLVKWALDVWRDPNADMKDRMAAFVWLSDRGLGKPLASLELSADVTAGPRLDAPRMLARLPSDVIDAVVRELDADPSLQLTDGDEPDDGSHG